jgi:hypothetical protein
MVVGLSHLDAAAAQSGGYVCASTMDSNHTK